MKHFLKLIFLSTVIFSLCSAQSIAPYGVSPRDAAADTSDIFDLAYNGVSNVGVGTKVYVAGTVTDSAGLVTPTWEITKMPFGSTATLGATADIDDSWLDTHEDPAEWNYIYRQVTSFVADVEGEYEITFTNGTDDPVTVRIHTAKYLGVDNCKACHSTEGLLGDGKYEDWLTTNHSDALNRGIDGLKGAYFNSRGDYCISCHSTGYDTNSDSDGFDDFEFVMPSPGMPGYADSLAGVYQEAMKRANIQCESCHGPGSGHLGVKENIAVTFESDNCAICHDAGTHHVFPEQWDLSGHGSSHTLYDRSSCAPCHNGQGFAQAMSGEEVAVDGLIAITCAACHDPHSNETEHHQLRTVTATLSNGYEVEDGGLGKFCMNCHKGRRDAEDYVLNNNVSSHFGPHYGTQADMITAQNLALNGMTVQANYGHFTFIEESCVSCHMWADGKVDDEGNPYTYGGHTFNMSDPDGNDNMDACSGCHPSYTESFDAVVFEWNGITDFDEDGESEGLQAEVQGLLDKLASLLEPYGEATVDYTTIDTPAERVGFFNYKFVKDDRSGGIHNPKLAISLLQENIRALGGYVSVNSPGLVPEEYRLSQNYPNPFNPATVIEYGLPVESNVNITIFNALGEVVETLVDEVKGAGNHTVNFNASQLASGVYIYRLQAENFVQVKKMMLMK